MTEILQEFSLKRLNLVFIIGSLDPVKVWLKFLNFSDLHLWKMLEYLNLVKLASKVLMQIQRLDYLASFCYGAINVTLGFYIRCRW